MAKLQGEMNTLDRLAAALLLHVNKPAPAFQLQYTHALLEMLQKPGKAIVHCMDQATSAGP